MIIFIVLIILAIYFFSTGQFFFSFLLLVLAVLSLVAEQPAETKRVKEKEEFKSLEGGEKVVAENLGDFINFIMHFVGRVVKIVFKPLEKEEKEEGKK